MHSAVSHGYSCRRHQLRYSVGDFKYAVYSIIKIIHLTAAAQFLIYSFPDYVLVILKNIGRYRKPLRRRFVYYAHIPYSGQRHMKSSRYRRCGQRQHIHFFSYLFYFFLMGNPKALFLVNHQKSQLIIFDMLSQQFMGSYNNVYFTRCQTFYNTLFFRRGAKTRQHCNVYRIVLHSLLKRVKMLCGQNCCRHEIRNLIPCHDRLKRTSERNLGLSVSNVSAQQSVHRIRLFHILFHLLYASELVVSFLKRELCFKIALPLIILRE